MLILAAFPLQVLVIAFLYRKGSNRRLDLLCTYIHRAVVKHHCFSLAGFSVLQCECSEQPPRCPTSSFYLGPVCPSWACAKTAKEGDNTRVSCHSVQRSQHSEIHLLGRKCFLPHSGRDYCSCGDTMLLSGPWRPRMRCFIWIYYIHSIETDGFFSVNTVLCCNAIKKIIIKICTCISIHSLLFLKLQWSKLSKQHMRN